MTAHPHTSAEEAIGRRSGGAAGDPRPVAAAPGSGERATPLAAGQRRAWIESLVLFGLGSALLLWTFRTEVAAAVALWSNSSTYGYGFFVLPITGFLIYLRRRELARLTPAATPWGLVPVVGLTLLWMLADLANIMVVQQLAFVGLWQSLFLSVMGWRVTRTVLFPLGYLVLAVPLGSEIIPLLQDITAQMVVHLLRLTGMPVFLDGYYIQIPSGSFLVAEACSGLNFLIVCIALGFLIAYLFFRSWPRRILFVVLSAVVPIVANGLRAYGIIMLAHLSDYRLAAGVDHIIYGFIFLSVIILVLIGIAVLLRERGAPERDAAAGRGSPAARASAMMPRKGSGLPGQVAVVALVLAVVLTGQGWTAAAKAPPEGSLSAGLEVPHRSSEWTEGGRPAWVADFARPDTTLIRSYGDGASQVDLQSAYYAYQREGAEALSELNVQLVGHSGWKMASQQKMTARIGGRELPATELIIRSGDDSRLVWYWYEIGGSPTNSRLLGKLLEMQAAMLGQDRAAFIVAVSTDMSEGRQAAAAVLERFLGANWRGNAGLVRVKD